MAEIIFKDNSIQTGHRIKIPKAIIDTLDLKVKQKIKIRFDVDKKSMIVEVEENEQEDVEIKADSLTIEDGDKKLSIESLEISEKKRKQKRI
jgi:hypothetical protein